MRSLLLPLALFLLAGCRVDPPNPAAKVDDTGEVPPTDMDGDGFSETEGDCDDADADVSPGATELCNGADDNCDDQVDENVLGTWYADTDGDGFGDPAVASEACEAGSGQVQNGTDCDDANRDAFPGNVEVCDEIDNDCDGVVDNGVTTTWYADVDLDGYGDPATGLAGCVQPAGTVADDTDCDDGTAASFPGNPEVCDGLDNNCDGVVDEGVTAAWYADVDGDGFGDPTIVEDACEIPAGYAATGDDCDDATAEVSPGAAEVCNGGDDDCDGTVDEPDAVDVLTWYTDADADGFGDPGSGTPACDAPAGMVADDTDCDDVRAATNPAATEYCNTYDDDCDGRVDESDAADAATWYVDADADGWGAPDATAVSCSAPAGYVASSSDCDDRDATASPSGIEVCDGADDDCDGVVDDGVATSTWYADADGDGWGDPDAYVVECAAPSGYVADADDCDDADPSVSPSESEVCDGFDEDCSGDIDDGAVCPCDVSWYNDHAYQFCTVGTTWVNAQAACSASGYHLVTVDTSAEDAWLVSTATGSYSSASDDYWWIGYNDRSTEGRWVWEDGSASTYTQWNSGEPNDSDGEDCAQLVWYTHWNDWDCGNTSTYICEAE